MSWFAQLSHNSAVNEPWKHHQTETSVFSSFAKLHCIWSCSLLCSVLCKCEDDSTTKPFAGLLSVSGYRFWVSELSSVLLHALKALQLKPYHPDLHCLMPKVRSGRRRGYRQTIVRTGRKVMVPDWRRTLLTLLGALSSMGA